MNLKMAIYHPRRFLMMFPQAKMEDFWRDYYDIEDGLSGKRTHPSRLVGEEYEMALANILSGKWSFSMESGPSPEESLYLMSVSDHGGMESMFEEFQHAGDNIFHISPGLTELLVNSSAEDIEISAIQLPFPSLYVYWGCSPGFKTPDGNNFYDGAYVSFMAEHPHYPGVELKPELVVSVTTVCQDIEAFCKKPYMQRLVLGCEHDSYGLDFSDERKTIGEALTNYTIKLEGVQPKKYHLTDLKKQQRLAILSLIINFICYLNYEKRKVVHKFPDSAAANLVRQTEAGIAKIAQRAESKLKNAGFTKIYICGGDMPHTQGSNAMGIGGPASHWRRGHWRNQACGPKQLERKLIWIMPTIVGGDRDSLPPRHGHLYVVNNPSQG